MSELDKLEQALREERVAPRAEAREAALAAALSAYDAKIASVRQGSGVGSRLRIAARAAGEILTGQRSMRMTHALMGGASLMVIALAVVTAANITTIQSFDWRNAPNAADEDRSRTDATVSTDAETKVEMEEAADIPMVEPSPPAEVAAVTPDAVAPLPAPEPGLTLQDLSTSIGSPDQFAASPQMAMREYSGAAANAPAYDMTEGGLPPLYHDQGRDNFETIETNPLKVTAEEPVSTFSIDVDTASYAFMRTSINNGVLPQDDAVRVEELINYFPYDYPGPATAETPFGTTATVMETPWNPETMLLHIGISGFDIIPAERPAANLVFLIDTSGSMEEQNKLPLLINSMKLLVDTLADGDTVSIVTYAGSAGTVLEPTKVFDKAKILAALDNLMAGGSTAGGEGVRQAYQLARQNFDENGVNRVILATDGDFNVGITDIDELQSFVERERETGVFLSVLGFGMGNYNDALMQALAQNGNGAAAYIDTLSEARKVLVEEATSTLFPIAKDVKIQVEFNPAMVSEYRLIGYETRLLNREDFNNDQIDAGEIGSGHTVTAIYEITPAGSAGELVDDLRYQTEAAPPAAGTGGEYAFLRLRYKLPEGDESQLIEMPIDASNEVSGTGGGVAASEARFAASVAAFGQILRGGGYTGDYSLDDVIALANASKGEDEFGYRAEFINLVRLAKSAASMERLQP